MQTHASNDHLPPPPSHHPAKQFDQTVGKFETRPSTRSVRSLDGGAWTNIQCRAKQQTSPHGKL
jgi:hypothetical protein